MKAVNLLVMLALVAFVSGGKAFAHGNHHPHQPPHHHPVPPPHYHDDPTDDALAATLLSELMTLTELSEAASNVDKVAIVNASPDALGVLNGGAPTDLFVNGKAAVEAALGVQIETDRQAAIIIMEFSERYSEQ